MQGIQSLMPGQAQQAPLPGMMPQQSSSTPGAMTGSLKNMPMEQLKMLFQNPQPGSPPLWAVISALAEKQKEAQAIQAAMGQGAMAQNAQMQQQPPVAAQVVQAAQGGIMQGYAGGGAVAFDRGHKDCHNRILKKICLTILAFPCASGGFVLRSGQNYLVNKGLAVRLQNASLRRLKAQRIRAMNCPVCWAECLRPSLCLCEIREA
jgi:hypothetical protein